MANRNACPWAKIDGLKQGVFKKPESKINLLSELRGVEEESSDGESDDEVRQSEASPALGGAEAGGFQGSGWPRGVAWGSGVLRALGGGKGPGNRQGRR